MKNKNIILHIGLPKAGSTTFQQKFLSFKNKDYKFIYKYYKLQNYLKSPENKIKKEIINEINEINEPNIFISNEGAFGHQANAFIDVKYRLELLDDLFNEPKYIIFFREPSTLIYSWYNFSLKKGITTNFVDYTSININSLNKITHVNNSLGTNYKIYNYNIIFKDYLKIINRVLFLEFEEFFIKKNSKEYDKLYYFIGKNLNLYPIRKYNQSIKNLIYIPYYKNNILLNFIKYFFKISIIKSFFEIFNIKYWSVISFFISLFNIFNKNKLATSVEQFNQSHLQEIKNFHKENYLLFKKKLIY
tara:strand:+ start:2305 stop:3213 length:909 start_codon:yes stop_codon:yes gene_type:complete